jgi:enoyl-CoA hydratase
MPEFQTIQLRRDGDVATVTLDRPDALNAITTEMLAELNDVFDELAGDPTLRVVVLTGAGRAFSAGVDLKALNGQPLIGGKVGDLLDLPARALIETIQAMAPIVIAKVNGFCFTGALELALACDLVVTADEAKLADTHAKFGIRPTWGMSQRLPRAVGAARARALSYTARTFSGREAAEWGLAAASAPAAELDAAVEEMVGQILANSRASLVAHQQLYRATAGSDLAAGLEAEATTDFEIDDTEERIAGFR